jgi:hypothetical protein
VTPKTWRETLRTRLKDIPWEQVQKDVEPFLLSQQESALLTWENLKKLLE